MEVIKGQLPKEYTDSFAPKPGATLFDKSIPGREGATLPNSGVPSAQLPPSRFLRATSPQLPELSEPDVVRHFTQLSKMNFSIGSGTYPLGSCTMKYNPEIHEAIVRMPEFANIHPEQPPETMQGTLEVLYGLQKYLAEITGMAETTITPMGGAHGEFTGVLMIKAYHESKGEGETRRKILIPSSAHGTNPATAAMAGYDTVELISGMDGNLDMDDFRKHMGDGKDIAGIMITQPNTLGLFDTNIFEVSKILHEAGALVYGDGANMNALMGKILPSAMGIDVMHINTHKALTTPHGGGGPGAGPVMVTQELAPFLPTPHVVFDEESKLYKLATPAQSIGRISGWSGNEGVLLRAYAYIRTMGAEGLREVAENAVLSGNYVIDALREDYDVQFGEGRRVMHEGVVNGNPKGNMIPGGHPNIDVAKRLIDYEFHPPTVSFPLKTDNALLIEPTETEGKEGLDRFIAAMKSIAQESRTNPDVFQSAPHFSPIGRLDEAEAARRPILKWTP